MYTHQYVKAIADFRRSLDARADDDWCLRHLAWIYVAGPAELRDASLARKLARSAVKLARERKKPSYGPSLSVLGMAHYRLNEFEAALKTFEEAIAASRAAPDPLALLGKAMCHHQLGEPQQAQESFVKAQAAIRKRPHTNLGDIEPIRAEAEQLLGTDRE